MVIRCPECSGTLHPTNHQLPYGTCRRQIEDATRNCIDDITELLRDSAKDEHLDTGDALEALHRAGTALAWVLVHINAKEKP